MNTFKDEIPLFPFYIVMLYIYI